MKFIVPFLLIVLQLIESTVGRCQLRATVRTEEDPTSPGEIVHQTQLQLLCSNMSCTMNNFIYDNYTDLGIPRDCMDENCSRIFNLCESTCTNVHQTTEPPTAPNPHARTDSVTTMTVNACPTNTSCTPITITTTTIVSPNSTTSTIGQRCFNVTSTVLSTITKTQEKTLIITHTTTPTPWTTQCPQTTTELMITTTTNESKVSESTPTQGNGSSSTISALGALLVFSLVLLALVTTGWVWTCWTARKREANINSRTKTNNINAPDMRVDINPAYEAQTPLQRNLAYEDTTLQSQSADEPQSSSTQDPMYEIIPPAASGNTITAQTQRSGEDGDEYDRLNRETSNTQ